MKVAVENILVLNSTVGTFFTFPIEILHGRNDAHDQFPITLVLKDHDEVLRLAGFATIVSKPHSATGRKIAPHVVIAVQKNDFGDNLVGCAATIEMLKEE